MEHITIIKEFSQAAERIIGKPIDEKILAEMLSHSQTAKYRKGQTILGIGEKLEYTGVILSGMARSYYLDINGNEHTRNFHKEYFMIMDEGLIGYKNSICAYEALEDTVLILFEISMLRNMFDENENLKDFYIASLEWGMKYKIYRENEFLTSNATQRYLKFREDFPEIADRVKQSYISTYLGIAPESLSRIRKALKEENGED